MMILVALCVVLACSAQTVRAAQLETTRAIEESKLIKAARLVNREYVYLVDTLGEKLKAIETDEGIDIIKDMNESMESGMKIVRKMNDGRFGYKQGFRTGQVIPCIEFLAETGNIALGLIMKFPRSAKSMVYKRLLGFAYCNFIVEYQSYINGVVLENDAR